MPSRILCQTGVRAPSPGLRDAHGLAVVDAAIKSRVAAWEASLDDAQRAKLRPEAQAALDELSNRLNRVAEQQLSGTVDRQEADSAQQAQSIRQAIADEEVREQQRSQQETRESFRELLAAQLANAGSFSARNAVTTYFNVSTL